MSTSQAQNQFILGQHMDLEIWIVFNLASVMWNHLLAGLSNIRSNLSKIKKV